ncbi:MAG: hypothetical protein MJD61_17980 [Proteobacteria bacterium]|nr:hypothetical protein [Pseudomonadota bacterium]
MTTSPEFELLLAEAEKALDRLRALYEQWFQGVERIEPMVPRKDVDRKLARLRRAAPRNTALRFRFQQLAQRYTSYSVYWRRVARQIEEGSYRRDQLRARRRRTAAAKPASSRPPASAASRPASPGTLSDKQLRHIYDHYVRARRANGEAVDNVRYQALASKLQALVPRLREKNPGKRIGFKIVVREGRVGIKPVAR